MSNEMITPERIALPKQVEAALLGGCVEGSMGHQWHVEGAKIALAALANEPHVDEKVLQAARRHWDAGGNSKGEQYDVFMCREHQQQCFLAPQPKLPEEWAAVIADYEGIEVRNLNDNQTRELFEKLFALTGGSQ